MPCNMQILPCKLNFFAREQFCCPDCASAPVASSASRPRLPEEGKKAAHTNDTRAEHVATLSPVDHVCACARQVLLGCGNLRSRRVPRTSPKRYAGEDSSKRGAPAFHSAHILRTYSSTYYTVYYELTTTDTNAKLSLLHINLTMCFCKRIRKSRARNDKKGVRIFITVERSRVHDVCKTHTFFWFQIF